MGRVESPQRPGSGDRSRSAGPLVACCGFCPAGLLARRAAAIQEISDGRLVLGLGAGWNETEFRAFGVPFDHRATRFSESFEIIRRLFAGERVTFEGRFEHVQDAVLLPRPDVPPPLMVGSTGERVLRAALAHADAWNIWYDWYGNTPEGFATENDRVSQLVREMDANLPTSSAVPRCSSPSRTAREIDHTRMTFPRSPGRPRPSRADSQSRGGRSPGSDLGRVSDHRARDPNARPHPDRTQQLTCRTDRVIVRFAAPRRPAAVWKADGPTRGGGTWRIRRPSRTPALSGRRSGERGGRFRSRTVDAWRAGDGPAQPSRATGPEATPVGGPAAAAPSPAHDRGRLAHRRGRRHRRHRADLRQRCLGRGDHRHRRRRHRRAVDERHRPAGHRRHRPRCELRGVVVGHRDHRLAAHRGADRVPAMAPPGDLPGGVAARAVRVRSCCTT